MSSPRPGCTPLHTYVAPPRGQRPGCVAQPGVRPVLLPFVFQHHFELKHALPHACFTPFFLPQRRPRLRPRDGSGDALSLHRISGSSASLSAPSERIRQFAAPKAFVASPRASSKA